MISLVGTVALTVAYSLYMFQSYPAGDAYSPEVFQFWGGFFVWMVLVSIVGHIILSIVMGIFNQEDDISFMDERDRLIEMKATRYSMYTFALGFISAMAALWLGQTPAVMFMLLFVGGFSAEVVSQVTQFVLYRRGF